MKRTIIKHILYILFLSIHNYSYAGIIILNGLTHEHQLANGIMTGIIVVKNDGASAERIVLYKQDLLLVCGKDADFSDSISHSFSLKPYLTLPFADKTLEPYEEVSIPYQISLDRSLPRGSYWSIIMVEGTKPLSTTNMKEGMSIDTKIRYALQIIGHHLPYEQAPLNFEQVNNQKKRPGALKTIQVTLSNQGLYAAKVKVTLEIYNANGEKIKVIESLTKRIYPSKCNVFDLEIKDIPLGKYEGIIVADNSTELFASNVVINID